MYRKLISAVLAALLTISLIPAISLAAERHEVLTIGDQDKWVFEIQQILYENGYLEFPATGYYGSDTQNAVMKFQEENDFHADGKAGPETRKAILDTAYSEIPETRLDSANNDFTEESDTITDVPDSVVTTTIITGSSDTAANGNSFGDTLRPGDKGSAISALQQSLKDLDYYDYSGITGYYGPVTEAAVKRFQRTNGLSESGIWDKTCSELLNSASVKPYIMNPGDKNDDISKMQQRLKELGYFSAEPTGYYGDATLTAVMAFQSKNGLNADG